MKQWSAKTAWWFHIVAIPSHLCNPDADMYPWGRSNHIQRFKMPYPGRYATTVSTTARSRGYKRTWKISVKSKKSHCSSHISRSTALTQRLTPHREALAIGWQTSSPARCRNPSQPPRPQSQRKRSISIQAMAIRRTRIKIRSLRNLRNRKRPSSVRSGWHCNERIRNLHIPSRSSSNSQISSRTCLPMPR